MKKIICPICEKEIKIGDIFVKYEGYCGFHREWHKECLDKLQPKICDKFDIEDLGEEIEEEI